jgi:hypothetical protein
VTLTVDLVLYIIAAVCFAVAGFGGGGRFNMVALGLLAWVLTAIL